MKKIVFVITPFIDRELYIYTPPFSVMQMLEHIQNKEECEVIDFAEMIYQNYFNEIDENFYEHCASLIYEYNPEIVTFVSTVFKTISSTLLIAQKIKCVNPEVKIILGGHHSSLHSDYLLSTFGFVDYIVKGFSATESANIFDEYIINGIIPITPSLCYRNNGKVTIGKYIVNEERNLVTNVTLQYNTNAHNQKFFLVENGFGCGRNCIRCNLCYAKGVRKKYDVKEVLKSIVSYCDKKDYVLYMYDLFLWSNQEVIKFCKELIEKKVTFKWYTRAMIDCLDEEILKVLYSSNCKHISIGIKKNIFGISNDDFRGFEKIERLVPIINKINLNITVYFDIGEENETDELLEFKLQFVYNLTKYNNISFFIGLFSFPQFQTKIPVEISKHLLKNIAFISNNKILAEDLKMISTNPELFSNLYAIKKGHGFKVYIINFSHEIFINFYETINKYLKENNNIRELLHHLYSMNNEHKSEKEIFLDEIIPYFNTIFGEYEGYKYEKILYFLKVGVIFNEEGLHKFNNDMYIYSSNYNSKKKIVDVKVLSYYLLKNRGKRVTVYKFNEIIYFALYDNIYINTELPKDIFEILKKNELL